MIVAPLPVIVMLYRFPDPIVVLVLSVTDADVMFNIISLSACCNALQREYQGHVAC